MADKASVYEANDTVLVVDAHLKVMLEEDYLAKEKHQLAPEDASSALGNQIVRQIVLPALEKEVNEGKNFALLRQIFHSIILAKWYKESLKTALLNQVYSNKAKIAGVGYISKMPQKSDINAIYQQYLQAYKKGVFNYIKEDVDQTNQQVITRKYFSGGVSAAMDLAMLTTHEFLSRTSFGLYKGLLLLISVAANINMAKISNAAMVSTAQPIAVADGSINVDKTTESAAAQGQGVFMEWFPNDGTELHSGESTYIPGDSLRLDFFWNRKAFRNSQAERYLELSPEVDGKISIFSRLDDGSLRVGGAIKSGEKIELPGTTLTYNGRGFICKYNGDDFVIVIDAAMKSGVSDGRKPHGHRISRKFYVNHPPSGLEVTRAFVKHRRNLGLSEKDQSGTVVVSSLENSKQAVVQVEKLIDSAINIILDERQPGKVLTTLRLLKSVLKNVQSQAYWQSLDQILKSDWDLLKMELDHNFTEIEPRNRLKAILNELKVKIHAEAGSKAMLSPGGIDLNASKIDLQRKGSGVNIAFDPAMIAQFKTRNFKGIVPVITAITPIASFYPLLGLKEPQENMKLANL